MEFHGIPWDSMEFHGIPWNGRAAWIVPQLSQLFRKLWVVEFSDALQVQSCLY